MPTLEKFVLNVSHLRLCEAGKLEYGYIPTQTAIATRPFLVAQRLEGIKRRTSQEFPLIISADQQNFVIDGHHKTRRNFDAGCFSIYSLILTTEHKILIAYLYEISHGYVKDLKIIN